MNNLILSLSVEARMIIAEIIALIGLTIIIAIYSNNKIKNLKYTHCKNKIITITHISFYNFFNFNISSNCIFLGQSTC